MLSEVNDDNIDADDDDDEDDLMEIVAWWRPRTWVRRVIISIKLSPLKALSRLSPICI